MALSRINLIEWLSSFSIYSYRYCPYNIGITAVTGHSCTFECENVSVPINYAFDYTYYNELKWLLLAILQIAIISFLINDRKMLKCMHVRQEQLEFRLDIFLATKIIWFNSFFLKKTQFSVIMNYCKLVYLKTRASTNMSTAPPAPICNEQQQYLAHLVSYSIACMNLGKSVVDV